MTQGLLLDAFIRNKKNRTGSDCNPFYILPRLKISIDVINASFHQIIIQKRIILLQKINKIHILT